MYGSHTAQASTLPPVNAASASAGCRYLTFTSLSFRPASLSEAISWKCADEPCATAMDLPLSSSGFRSDEFFGTRMASPLDVPCQAATTETFEPAPAAKTGGVLPTPPMSTALALTASRRGGPEVNVDHLIL